MTDLLWREKLVKRWAKREGFPRSEVLREGSQNIRFHLTYIDYLYQQRKWLAGDELTLADIAAAAHLSVLDYLGDVPWDAARRAPGLVRQDEVAPLGAAAADGPADRPEAAGALRRSGLLIRPGCGSTSGDVCSRQCPQRLTR